MFSYFKKFFNLLATSRLNFFLILILSTLVSLMDAIGILSILPIVWIITDIDSFKLLIEGYKINFLDNIMSNTITDIVIIFSMFSIFCFSLKIFSSIYIQYILNKFAYSRMFDLRKKILSQIIHLNYLTFQKLNRNESINIILTTVHEFIELSLRPFLKIFSETMIMLILLIVLILSDTKVTLIIIAFLTLLSLIYYFSIRKKILKYGTISDKANIKIIETANNNINGFIDLKILNLSNTFFNIFNNHIKNYSNTKTKSVTIELIPKYLFEFSIFILLNLIIVFYSISGNYDFIIQNISLLAIISVRLLPAISVLSSSLVSIRFSSYHLNKLYNFTLDINKLSKLDKNNKNILKEPFESLKIEKLSFSYNNNKIFNNLNFTINKNDFIGLIGSSGSGKSTFIKIISQILTSKNGLILINNKNADNINFQNKICLISQNFFLINGTIKENIILNFDKNTDYDNEIIKILKDVNLYDELISSGRDIYSEISQDGVELSGGQKQRLIIARSLFFKREFFIFDEAASSLDIENTNSVINTLISLKNKITLIYITHNQETLLFCDKIFKVNNSKLDEFKIK